MKTLLLMRHAKSDWNADYESDHDRPLNERGERSARLMGRLLASREESPSLVISSTATRARRTAELAAASGDWGSDLRLDSGLYGSGPETVLEIAGEAPGVSRLMLVGHQPTWSALASRLVGASVEMKTATVAQVQLWIVSWRELPGARGVLTSLINPRPFFGSEWDQPEQGQEG